MTQHFAVLPSGDVYSFGKREALDYVERVEGACYATDDAEGGLKNVPTPLLIVLHNIIRHEKPVQRFSDRATAEKRMKGVLEAMAKPGALAPAAPEPIDAHDESSTGSDEGTQHDAPPASPESPAANDAPTEESTMAGKTKGKRAAAKKSAAKKTGTTAAKRTPRAEPISDATLERVKKMRDDGKNWDEIRAALGGMTVAFVFRVRPLLKKRWPSSVKNIGPGSAGYGKGATKKKKNGGK